MGRRDTYSTQTSLTAAQSSLMSKADVVLSVRSDAGEHAAMRPVLDSRLSDKQSPQQLQSNSTPRVIASESPHQQRKGEAGIQIFRHAGDTEVAMANPKEALEKVRKTLADHSRRSRSARSSVNRSAGLAGGEVSSRMFLSEPSLALQAPARDSLHVSATATSAVPASHGSVTGSAVTAVSQQADAAAGVHSAGAPSDANHHPPVSPTTRLGLVYTPRYQRQGLT